MHEQKGVPGGRMPKITNSIIHLMMARWLLAETGIVMPVVENHKDLIAYEYIMILV